MVSSFQRIKILSPTTTMAPCSSLRPGQVPTRVNQEDPSVPHQHPWLISIEIAPFRCHNRDSCSQSLTIHCPSPFEIASAQDEEERFHSGQLVHRHFFRFLPVDDSSRSIPKRIPGEIGFSRCCCHWGVLYSRNTSIGGTRNHEYALRTEVRNPPTATRLEEGHSSCKRQAKELFLHLLHLP